MLGKFPIRVMPSKTAIVPVNTNFLPRTQEELERCARTVYVANIDKKVDMGDVRVFFQNICGKLATCPPSLVGVSSSMTAVSQ